MPIILVGGVRHIAAISTLTCEFVERIFPGSGLLYAGGMPPSHYSFS